MKPLNWVLRALILMATALLFIPSISLSGFGFRPRIIVLVDASMSMNSAQKRQQWEEISGQLEDLRNEAILRFFSFSDSTASIFNLSTIQFTGKSTDIGGAIGQLVVDKADGLLVISDGRHNGPGSPLSEKLDIPCWVLAVGEEGILNLAIEEAFVEADETSSMRVRIRSSGVEPQRVRLRVETENGIGATRLVSLASDCLTEVAVELPDVETTVWNLELDSLAGEDQIDDNLLVIPAVPGEKKYDVLFVASSLSAETELILEALRRLSRVNLHAWIEISPGIMEGEKVLAPDVIILGPVKSNLSEPAVDFVSTKARQGIPLFFLEAGPEIPTGLQPFTPLIYQGRERASESVLNSTPTGEILIAGWDQVVGLSGTTADVYSVKLDGAEVLLGDEETAFIAERTSSPFALGVQIPGFLSAARGDFTGFIDFLNTSIPYLAEGEAFPFRMTVTQAFETSIELNLYSEINVEGSDLEAWLTPDSNSLRVQPLSSSSFLLAGTAPADRYTLNVSWNGERKDLGLVEVEPSQPESPSRGVNSELLERLAAMHGGKMLTVNDLGDLSDEFPFTKEVHFKPLSGPWVVLIVGALLLIEIWYRRRNGLP